MTKITHINDPGLIPKAKTGVQQNSTPGAFNQVLKQVTTRQDETASSRLNPPGPLPPPMAMMPIATEPADDIKAFEDLSQKTTSLVEQLESLVADLEDTGISFKDMEGAVSAMDMAAEKLAESASDSVLDTPSEMVRAAKTAALTARVEAIKFNRGDYL